MSPTNDHRRRRPTSQTTAAVARTRANRSVPAAAAGASSSAAGGILRASSGRAIAMTEQAYILLLQVIHEHAPHIIKYAFYDMGYRAGLELMASLGERAADPEAAFRHFVELFSESGYGQLEVLHFDLAAPEARLRGTNLFEAGLVGEADIYRTPRAVDHYSRGMFAGFMSELLQREVVCEELACQFRGDPACDFIVLPFQV